MKNHPLKLIMISALAAATCGCATTVARDGTSSSQANRDIAECKYEGDKAAPNNAFTANDLARQCLALRGYRKQ